MTFDGKYHNGYWEFAVEPRYDLPPGNIVIWRGLSRFSNIELGGAMAKTCV